MLWNALWFKRNAPSKKHPLSLGAFERVAVMLSVTKSHKTGKWPTNHLQGHIKPSGHINKTVCALGSAGTRRLAVPRDRREFITLLGGAVSMFLCASAAAQEGYYGVGHDKWHQGFYSKLKRNDGQGSCCSLMDCRPTQSRMVGDHYEVKVDGCPYRKPKTADCDCESADTRSR